MQNPADFSMNSLPTLGGILQSATGLPEVRDLLGEFGLDALQSGPGDGSWELAVWNWPGASLVDLRAGASAVFFGKVAMGRIGHAWMQEGTGDAFLAGIPWTHGAVGVFGGGQMFALRIPGGSRLRLLFSKPRSPVSKPGLPSLLQAEPDFFRRVEEILPRSGDSIPGPAQLEPLLEEIRGLKGKVVPLPLKARRHVERTVLALEIFRAAPEKSISPVEASRAMSISLRTFENACLSVTGFPPAVLLRIVRLNAVRILLERGLEKKVTRAANMVGLWHHGRFSGFYKEIFGESPRRTVARVKGKETAARPAGILPSGLASRLPAA